MDLSKLPRLSQTPSPPPGHNPDAPPEPPVKDPHARGFPVVPVGQSADAAPVDYRAPVLYCRCGAQLPPGTRFCSNCGASFAEATGDARAYRRGGAAGDFGGMWVEAFLSIALGLFLLFMAPMGIRYWGAKITGGTFAPYDHPQVPGEKVDFTRWRDNQTGAVTDIKYRDTIQFWSDTAITAFALVLILEGIVFAFVRNRWIILLAAVLTGAVTIGNLVYMVSTFSQGFAPMSALAVIFGVLMTGFQVKMFLEMRR